MHCISRSRSTAEFTKPLINLMALDVKNRQRECLGKALHVAFELVKITVTRPILLFGCKEFFDEVWQLRPYADSLVALRIVTHCGKERFAFKNFSALSVFLDCGKQRNSCRFKDRLCRIVGFPLGDAQPCGFRQPCCNLSRCHLSFPLRFVDCRKTLPHALSISVVGDEESRQASVATAVNRHRDGT